MQRTISVMVGKGSINHNSREFITDNVNGDRTDFDVCYCNDKIQKVYHELFDEALKKYNAKQTRKDRVIKNYYKKICSGEQEKPFHEVIFQIGSTETMGTETENGELAKKLLAEFYKEFQERNPYLRVFSAHLHMDESVPHLHIDFVQFTTGSKRGLETRVTLKQALFNQGFKGEGRENTEWAQWVQSEKEQVSVVMERYGIGWEHKNTHEEHLDLLNFKKRERIKEIAALEEQISEKKEDLGSAKERIESFNDGVASVEKIKDILETDEDYQLSEPQPLMSAKSYKSKIVEPLIARLKKLVQSVMVRYYEAVDSYKRLNLYNGQLYKENEKLTNENTKLKSENGKLQESNKDYKLLRKVFGDKQIDDLLVKAKESTQSKQRIKRFGNKDFER